MISYVPKTVSKLRYVKIINIKKLLTSQSLKNCQSEKWKTFANESLNIQKVVFLQSPETSKKHV